MMWLELLASQNIPSARKECGAAQAPDSLQWWMEKYLDLVIRGVRPDNVTKKIELHLTRFREHFAEAYEHDRATRQCRGSPTDRLPSPLRSVASGTTGPGISNVVVVTGAQASSSNQ